MRYWEYFPRFPKSKPRQAKGGIRAQSKRGRAFGETWWAKRWIDVLESFNIGARLDRGRSYARRGQVLSIDIDKGKVVAKVQGSQPRPYAIKIEMQVLSPGDWKKVVNVLSRQALFAAKLLAGEMPQDIEKVFDEAGLSLFPRQSRDLVTDCSCPDWSNPCKHIAAVYYLLGEEFDRDPFLLFKLRGLSREELIPLLGEAGGAGASPADEPAVASPPEPLPASSDAFWKSGQLPEDFFGQVALPPVSAHLLRRLGNFPFWRGAERLSEVIVPAYRAAAARGLDVFLGEAQPGSAPTARKPAQRQQ
jgi:uncharacterized Zn finger protein